MEIKFYELAAATLLIVLHVTAGQTVDTNVTAFVGENVQLPCSTEGLSDVFEVIWSDPSNNVLTRNETVVSSEPLRLSVNVTGSTMSLQISDVDVVDDGIYICYINSTREHLRYVRLSVTQGFELLVSDSTDTLPPTTVSDTLPQKIIGEDSTTADPYKCSATNPCLNEGNCSAEGVCQCAGNFSGLFCDISLVCPPNVCNINNTQNCSVLVTSGVVDYRCRCLPFYRGNQCEVYDYCQYFPCQNYGICSLVRQDSSGEYRCQCVRGGDESQDCRLNERDDCSLRPPKNPESFVTCIDKIGDIGRPGSFEMVCAPGYTGRSCETKQTPGLFCTRHGQNYCADEGYCKPLCNFDVCNGTQNCQFTADPYNTTGFLKTPTCKQAFADGYDLRDCRNETTLFDGFDLVLPKLTDCSPYFSTVCTREFGNGECKPECNNEACLWDGFDCYKGDEPEPLAGVVVMELVTHPIANEEQLQRNISMMLRARVNISFEEDLDNPYSHPVYSLKISHTKFSSVLYAGKFLAAVIAKKPYWWDGVKVKDVFICEAGSYSSEYTDKCSKRCGTCNPIGEVCDWRNGVCLHGCPPAHWHSTCIPCTTCRQQGDVCEWDTGKCVFGCLPGHWGDNCQPCSTCNQTGDICNNQTGECLHGCISNHFYGEMCKQCSENCVDGCNSEGVCNSCSLDQFGPQCENPCDHSCVNHTCDRNTGQCDCGKGNFWFQHENLCQFCSNGCSNFCEDLTGACECKPGYFGSNCKEHCSTHCLNHTCNVNGTCDFGCRDGFYGDSCDNMCSVRCNTCIDERDCAGDCKQGFEGQSCEKSSGQSGTYVQATTDTTGIIVGVVISIVIIVLILVVACCYWRRRQSGDYVMEDEEVEPTIKHHSVTVHMNTYMQPALAVGQSTDMIELDDRLDIAAVYAGPGTDQKAESERLLDSADDTPTDKNSADDVSKANAPSEDTDDIVRPSQHTGSNKQHKSSVLIEVGSNGRVLSISSEPEEPLSPTHTNPVSEEQAEDDSAFRNSPPQSPLGDVRAPLASEEDLLSNLGPLKLDKTDKPHGLDEEVTDEDNRSDSSRSRSSKSSSKSTSRKSSSSSGNESDEEVTEM